MKKLVFVPKDQADGKPKFSGSIELQPLSFDERFDVIETIGYEVSDDGHVDAKIGSGKDQLQKIRKLVALTKDKYLKVELTRIADGEFYSSFDELSCDPDCTSVLIGAASFLLSGAKVGNG